MVNKLTAHIETTTARRDILPWTIIHRRGRHSVDTQCFALAGYAEKELREKDGATQEAARDQLELALRHFMALEYIPVPESETEEFFEKKLVALERALNQNKSALSLSIAAGVTYGPKVWFALSGDILALQVNSLQVSAVHDAPEENYLHFDTFRSGELNPRSHLIFMPKSMAALIKSNELKQLALVTSTGRKLEYFEHLWQKRSTLLGPFCAVLLTARSKATAGGETTAASIGQLLATEAKTEELLSPPLLRPFLMKSQTALKKGYAGLERLAHHFNDRIKKTRAMSGQSPQNSTPPLTHAFEQISAKLKKIYSRPGQKLTKTFTRLPSSLKIRPNLNLFQKFNILPQKSKLFLIFGIIFLFVFAESILFTGRHHNIAATKNILNEEVQKIKELIDDSSAALIYNDEDGARSSLAAAYERLEKLPELQKQLTQSISLRTLWPVAGTLTKEKIVELQNALLPLTQKLQRASTLENPSTTLNLAEVLPEPLGIALKDGILFAYNKNALVRYEKSVTQKMDIALPTAQGAINYVLPHETRDTLLIVSGDLAYLYNTQTKTLGEAVLLQGQPQDAALYRGRLYTLENRQNQIYKYEPVSQVFSAGASWITDGTLVSSGRALAIDGAIYVLSDKGEVTEFLRGRKRDFALKGIDPAFTETTVLWTDENSNYLYILEPIQKRLAVFGKDDGVLKIQYLLPTLEVLRDFTVDETKKTAYLLDGPSVVVIPLTHFISK